MNNSSKKKQNPVSGSVFNIQKFSVNDGPGIRTVVFFKGCPLRCRWCANPESQSSSFQILKDSRRCIGCGRCVRICPVQAMQIRDGKAVIDPQTCSRCGRCVSACLQQALKLQGKTMTVDEVMEQVMQDQVFYEESGGGMTLSGGEILMQPAFAAALLAQAKARGLDTCIETTGYGRREDFLAVLAHTDHILFDFKHADPEKHRRGTGADPKQILANLALALESGRQVTIRIPVIPDFNSTLEDAGQMAAALQKMNASDVQLLPFHQFGESKYAGLQMAYAYENVPALHPEDLQAYRQVFLDHGLNAFF